MFQNILLKSLRKTANLSQRQLAKELNIGISLIGMYETGARNPSFENLVKIANYFNVSTDVLLGNDSLSDNYYFDIDLEKIKKAREQMDQQEKQKMIQLLELCFDKYFK